jgi:hypothetical protein
LRLLIISILYYPWAEANRANKESAGFYFLIFLGLKPAGLIRNQQDFISLFFLGLKPTGLIKNQQDYISLFIWG